MQVQLVAETVSVMVTLPMEWQSTWQAKAD
jgi:hypothetical protein